MIHTKNSKQRSQILELLKSVTCHPTADWIYKKLKVTMPDLSLATVYRNLKLLAKLGKITELTYGNNKSRFDFNIETHYHFLCIKCNNVSDLRIKALSGIEDFICKEHGHKVIDHRIEVVGICKDCINK